MHAACSILAFCMNGCAIDLMLRCAQRLGDGLERLIPRGVLAHLNVARLPGRGVPEAGRKAVVGSVAEMLGSVLRLASRCDRHVAEYQWRALRQGHPWR